ncbi:MAG: hypothetical protein Q8O53_01840 [Candidatus Moranbacteria bacterium]|nr:hypothetical protein [Candidatus Moranbacteria bacterium]
MKTLLNLLPEERRAAIQKHLRSRFLLWQLFLLFVLEVFYLAIVVSIYLVLDFQQRALLATGENGTLSSPAEERRLNEYEEKIKETNELVGVIGKIDRSHRYFYKVFVLLDLLLPPGVTIDHIQTKEYTLSVFGRAAKREDLLLLDQKLKSAEACIATVDIPISNLFSQENIDFQMDLTLVPDCLKKDTL